MANIFRSKPDYLRRREAAAEPIAQPTASQAPQSSEPAAAPGGAPSALKSVGGFLLGAAKGVGESAKNFLVGQDIDVFGTKVEQPGLLGMQNPLFAAGTRALRNAPIMQRVDEAMKPQGKAEEAGYAVEKIGEFFIPGKAGMSGQAALSASRAAQAAKGASKIAQKVVPRLAQMGTEAASTAGIAASQRGEFGKEGLREAAFSAAVAPLGKIPGIAFGGSQVIQGASQVSEGDIASGATNIGLGLAQAWSSAKQKGILLDEPVSMVIKGGTPQVSGEPQRKDISMAIEQLPTLRQRWGERISNASLRFTKSDRDAGADVKTGAVYDVQRSSLGETLDETQKRIAGYNDVVKEVVAKSGDPMLIDARPALESVRKKYAAPGTSLSAPKYAKIIDEVESALDSFMPDWKDRKLAVTEALKMRREFGKQAVFHHDPINKGDNALKEEIYNALYIEMKKELDANLPPQFKGANEALSRLIPYQNAILRRLPIEERQNILTITDNMTTLAGIFDPKALALGFINRVTRSPSVGRMLMQSGPIEKPFLPGDIPAAPVYPQIPERTSFRPPDVIQVEGRRMPDTTPAPGFYPQGTPSPKQAEQIRLEMLQEAAERSRDMPIMSRMANYQDVELRTMSTDIPSAPPRAPDMLRPRTNAGIRSVPKPVIMSVQPKKTKNPR